MILQKITIRFLDRFFPRFLSQRIYNYLSNPNIRKLRDFEETILAKAKDTRIRFKNFDIQCYEWGQPDHPVVLLVHGWEGQAGNFGAMIDALLAKKYRIIAFDGPAHGKSSVAPTSMFEHGELTSFMIQKHHPQVIVSHSFGSVATMMGLVQNQDWTVDRWLLVTTPYDFRNRVKGVAAHFGLGDRTVQYVIDKVEAEIGESIDNMNMKAYSNRVQNVQDALIVHSKTDRIIPIASSLATHQVLPFSNFKELDGLGHYVILWSDELLELVQEYIPTCTPMPS